MKTYILTTLTILAFTFTAFAQKGIKSVKKEERKAQKIAFITERLTLTPEESKALWPVYEQREEDRKAARKRIKGEKKDHPKKKIEEMTDAEVKMLLNKTLERKEADLIIDKKYNEKFLSILPPKKVAKLYHIEREFRKYKKEQRSLKK